MATPDNEDSFSESNKFPAYCPKQLYFKSSSQYIPNPEALGYTMGKTLGTGTYAKVKAAWSPYEGRMVSIILNFLIY